MHYSDEKRQESLNRLSEMLDGIKENFETIGAIRVNFPNLPNELMEYIEASAKAIGDLGLALIQANETILKLDDLLGEKEGK